MRLNKVDLVGIDTSNLKTLKESEKRELLALSKNGDMDAREKLILGNLRLVLSVVGRFNPRSNESADDLFQVGVIGLIKAIDNFDITLGLRLSTYAVPMVIGEIRRYRVRIRYRQPLQDATLIMRENGLYILFDTPQRGITPGQIAVWYAPVEESLATRAKDTSVEMLGSGVI